MRKPAKIGHVASGLKPLAPRGLQRVGLRSFPATNMGSRSARGSTSSVYAATPEVHFTEEERQYFLSRPEPRPSKREQAVELGLGSLALILGTVFSLALANSP